MSSIWCQKQVIINLMYERNWVNFKHLPKNNFWTFCRFKLFWFCENYFDICEKGEKMFSWAFFISVIWSWSETKKSRQNMAKDCVDWILSCRAPKWYRLFFKKSVKLNLSVTFNKIPITFQAKRSRKKATTQNWPTKMIKHVRVLINFK